MNLMQDEREYQTYFVARLVEAGYEERDASCFDAKFAEDRETLLGFLSDTQPESCAHLRRMLGERFEDAVCERVNSKAVHGGIYDVFVDGVNVEGVKLRFMYTPPAKHDANPKAERLAALNRFTVMQEVRASERERADVVLFLNGLPFAVFELKCQTAGQTWEDAVAQFRTSRSPATRLFLPTGGALVYFAQDTQEVHMTPRLAGPSTRFLPFNRGTSDGMDSGAGNPVSPGGYAVSYMWRDILTKETVLRLLSEFIIKTDGGIVFPRYHQLDAVRRLTDAAREAGTSRNYLIQHSAGSGKTNTIAWLSKKLATLHNDAGERVYDKVVVVTDRLVVDRQLQEAIKAINHENAFVSEMGEGKNWEDLSKALTGSAGIVVTTIQKFPWVVKRADAVADRKFAVLIDEAHSSTSGADMRALNTAMGAAPDGDDDAEDAITDIVGARDGKNIAFFAFTATPKAKTLALFGTSAPGGKKRAFHTYSMKQAIEEGFILNVLQNYTEYNTHYNLTQKNGDPLVKEPVAARAIKQFIATHDENVSQRAMIIANHFWENIRGGLGGEAKAMVVTGSREEAVKYTLALRAFGSALYGGALRVYGAFTGKVKVNDEEYTESALNGVSESALRTVFDKEGDILVVANKYQTGFDQPKLCAMYVMKKLRGVNAVQTLSRLNRVCTSFDKKTFVLDFENTCEDMVDAFKPYYTTTVLSGEVSEEALRELSRKLDEYCVLDDGDIADAAKLFELQKHGKDKVTRKDEGYFESLLESAKRRYDALPEDAPADGAHTRRAFRLTASKFVNYYEFLTLAVGYKNPQMRSRALFTKALLKYIGKNRDEGVDIRKYLEAANFTNEKGTETPDTTIDGGEEVTPPKPGAGDPAEIQKVRLSEIVAGLNARYGKNFDSDVASKFFFQVRDLMLKDAGLKSFAEHNSEQNFAQAYNDALVSKLSDAYSQNTDLCNIFLNSESERKGAFAIFLPEVYKTLRGGGALFIAQPK